MKLFASASFLVFALLWPCAAADSPDLSEQYQATANKIIAAAMQDNDAYSRLEYLCDRIGNRLTGSPDLERAIAWSAEQMKAVGLSNVRVIPAKVPHWVRGDEFARVLSPVDKPLHMLGLGMSVGTPPGGITAEVLAVNDFDELSKLTREKVEGKIVVYNEPYKGYGSTVVYRSSGASRAAALGAVAALVRSIGPAATQTPHTGTMRYDPAQPRIPVAAISAEDAMMIYRLCANGVPVRVHLEMGARQEPDSDSGNVIGEIPGKEHPEEVVVIGGHTDSWDVGQGAQDDGAAIMASLQAMAVLKQLGLQPRRTLRLAFWVNEENGTRGGEAYRAWVGDQIKNHVAAIEMDGGAETPRGFGASVDAPSAAMLKQIGRLLEPIGAGAVSGDGGGEDISALIRDGVPGLSEQAAGTHYFEWHHTDADTFDKVNLEDLRKSIAAMAVMGYVLADMPDRLTPAPRSESR